MDSLGLFFSLLKHYLGNGPRPSVGGEDSWQEVYDTAKDQALTGILFSVVEGYPKEETAPRALLREWLSDSLVIARKNISADEAVGKLFSDFNGSGYRCVLLKGQGAALMYPTPKYRSSGDIDLWVEGGRDDVVAKIRQRRPSSRICYNHGDYGEVDGVPVEVHFLPTWLYNPFHDRRIQSYFDAELARDKVRHVTIGSAEVQVPGSDFNAVFMLAHMYKHIFNEGLGLRQLMDYYFVLVDPGLDREKAVKAIRSTGLSRFAEAVMFVEGEVFGLPDDKMLVKPDERIGRFLLEDVMRAGNFGVKERKEGTRKGGRSYKRARLWRFLSCFPSEVLWAPLWKAWHWVWRHWKGYL